LGDPTNDTGLLDGSDRRQWQRNFRRSCDGSAAPVAIQRPYAHCVVVPYSGHLRDAPDSPRTAPVSEMSLRSPSGVRARQSVRVLPEVKAAAIAYRQLHEIEVVLREEVIDACLRSQSGPTTTVLLLYKIPRRETEICPSSHPRTATQLLRSHRPASWLDHRNRARPCCRGLSNIVP